ncbi:MAG: hypothetical protein U0746_13665 [Gemmataceae bacterium]
MFQGLRTAGYSAPDLDRAKAWYTTVLGYGPYFDDSCYVGYNVGGYELGLIPDATASGPGGSTVFWGVPDASAAYERLLSLGATPYEPVKDVGGNIKIGSVLDPFGNVLGVIENPHFKLPPD